MNEPRVALTFDAEHPSRPANRPDGAERILDALEDAGARATFFVQGRWASAFPATVARMAAGGHVVGNHSNYHAPMTLLSASGVERDVRAAQERIVDACATDPRPWFRCPFGEGADDATVVAALEALGYRNVHWTVDSADWRDASPDGIGRATLDGIADRASAIVLFHTWPAATAEALPVILQRLRGDGTTFVTVEEALDAR